MGFSLWWPPLLRSPSSAAPTVVAHRLNCPGMWNLSPRAWTEFTSSRLTAMFLTTGPPGKSLHQYLFTVSGCKSWTVKKAECQRIDAFELWCWRRLLRVPWTARRSSQSILKEISPEYSLERLMLKLKLQYFDHLMQRTD